MKKRFSPFAVYCLLFALVLSVTGCGGGGDTSTSGAQDTVVFGIAATGQAINGTATLRDKNGVTRTTTISQPDGTFEFDVAGLKPPYFLKATPGNGGSELYSVATDAGNFNINPLANLTVLAAAKDIVPVTNSPDVPFNDPASFSTLTADRVEIAVDRVMSRMSPEFQAALAANGASGVNPLTDVLHIGEGLDGVLDNFEITLDSTTGLILEQRIAGNTTALLGTVDILGPSSVTDCNQSPAASVPTPPAGTLIVVAIPACKTYDAVPFSGGNGVVYIGLLDGDTPAVLGGTLSYGGTSQGARNVGSYTIVPGGLTSDRYAISYVESTLMISQLSLPTVIVNAPRIYDSGSNGAGPGLAGSDPITIPAVSSISTVPAVSVTTVSGSGALASNYSITPTNTTTFAITPVQVQLTSPSVPAGQ
jgi:hypothetical protein